MSVVELFPERRIIGDQNHALARCHATLKKCLQALTWYHALGFEGEDGTPIGKEIAETLTLIRGGKPTIILDMTEECVS